jgi:hypothetical protein
MDTGFDAGSVSVVLTLVLLAAAAATHWRGWGRDRFGPVLAAVLLVPAGVGLLPVAGPVVRWALTYVTAGFVVIASYFSASGPALDIIRTVTTNLGWVAGVVVLFVWVESVIPFVDHDMTWDLAWAGAAIPALIASAPAQWARASQVLLRLVVAFGEAGRMAVLFLLTRGR